MYISCTRIAILNACLPGHLYFYEGMLPIGSHYIHPMATAIRWKKISDEDMIQLPRSVR